MASLCDVTHTAVLAPHDTSNLYFYLWRPASFFFFLLIVFTYLIHNMVFLSLTSAARLRCKQENNSPKPGWLSVNVTMAERVEVREGSVGFGFVFTGAC
jgi:hypothetical protein